MKRLFALLICMCAVAGAVASCGGGVNYDYTAVPDKLTVVGAGS